MIVTGRVAAFFTLILLVPVLGLIALALWCSDPGAVLFSQIRVGQFGKHFTMYKFRSMRSTAGLLLTCSRDPRITTAGRFLRASKFDELPQLWNILCGEMAWIGPRPEIPEFVDMNDPLWREVLELRPGLADAASFAFHNEEQLLAGVADPQDYYRREILPRKLRISLSRSR